ncbi:mucin-like protein [Sycon ciliatum]|uniref:mucin-like protein n=1 Tax=Sycon ciliatum TaxID=27933 RepID=UPI0031F62BA9
MRGNGFELCSRQQQEGVPLIFGQRSFLSAIVGGDGYVSFVNNLPVSIFLAGLTSQTNNPVIAPLWANNDIGLGEVLYGVRTDSATISATVALLQAGAVGGAASDFRPREVLVVTWTFMQASPGGQAGRNSMLPDLGFNHYQLIVAWDECQTFTIFLFNDIAWTVGQFNAPTFSRIWDGDALTYTGDRPFDRSINVFELTNGCTGEALLDLQCTLELAALPPLQSGLFPFFRRCPSISLWFFLGLPTAGGFINSEPFQSICFIQRAFFFFPPSPNAVCCYRFPGFFRPHIASGAGGGWITNRFASVAAARQERSARDACCAAGNCARFFAVRPRTRPRITPPFFFAWFFGDPHLQTLDGRNFTFNGYGEYRLIRARDSMSSMEVEAQIRTTPLTTGPNATVVTAGAIGLFSDSGDLMTRLQFTSNSSTASMVILLNGEQDITSDVYGLAVADGMGIPDMFAPDDTVTLMRTDTNSVTCTFSNQAAFLVSVGEAGGVVTMTVSPRLPEEFQGETTGLMGVFNGDSEDDFLNRQGETLPSSASEQDIFSSFGQTWQILGSETLFTYPPGLGPDDFAFPNFVPVFSDNLTISDEARAACGGNTACLFDAAATGNVMVGMQSRDTDDMLNTQLSISLNIAPLIEGAEQIDAVLGQLVMYTVTITDVDQVVLVVEAANNTVLPNDFNLTLVGREGNITTYNLFWTPSAADTMVSLEFTATDDNNVNSTFQPAIVLCPCENMQPCFPQQTGQDGGLAQFTLLECNCNESYTGDRCEEDRDGCVQGAGCFQGVICTDVPAPGSGAICRDCPSGTTGDGVMCMDIAECMTMPCDGNAMCTETFGSFNCTCLIGYTGNGMSCSDIDECTTDTDDCSPMAMCANVAGSFSCNCNDGFEGSGQICDDIDECVVGGHLCDAAGICLNTVGGSMCDGCIPGFVGNGNAGNCSDEEQCVTGTHTCSELAMCSDSFGSFECQCLAGFNGDGMNCQGSLNLNGFNNTFRTEFMENQPVPTILSLQHAAALVGQSAACQVSITLAALSGDLDDPTQEKIFPTKAISATNIDKIFSARQLIYNSTDGGAISTEDLLTIVQNSEYIDTAMEPAIAVRQVMWELRECGTLDVIATATTFIDIVRINDNPPVIQFDITGGIV